MSELIYDIAVIGGGASGMMAALSAAKASPGLRIAVTERLNRVGKKLMATGNGRCNLTNTAASERDYHGSVSFMRPAMTAFPPEAVMNRFMELGVYPRVEEDGKVYPMSDQASSVLDALRLSMEECSIEEICDFEAVSLTRAKEGYRLTAKDGRQLIARRIICAAGGLAAPSLGGSASGYRLLESCGHELTPRFPALVQLKTNPDYTRPLKGTKYAGKIDLMIDERIVRTETGEILFTEYGLSGIAVMQLSRIASEALNAKRPRRVSARLHLLPMSTEQAVSLLTQRRELLSRRPLENFLTGLVNKRAGQMLIKWSTGLALSEPSSALTDEHLAALASMLTGWTLEITGTQGFDQAQVTAGGVDTRDVNPDTMESLLADGLYITGEILDIDGDCGGFNLQWAWASGMLAGESCAMSLDPSARSSAQARPAHRPAGFHSEPPRKPYQNQPEAHPSRPSRPHPENARRDGRSELPRHTPRNPKPASPSPKSSRPSKGMRKPHD